MKLFAFEGAETDWVAAHDLAEARDCLRRTYGIGDDDIDGSYQDITECDPSEVEFYLDETDPDTEENLTETAAAKMAGKTKPFVVGSTYE